MASFLRGGYRFAGIIQCYVSLDPGKLTEGT